MHFIILEIYLFALTRTSIPKSLFISVMEPLSWIFDLQNRWSCLKHHVYSCTLMYIWEDSRALSHVAKLLFFLVWGHPHTTQIVVIDTKMCCSLAACSQYVCCWCNKMMCFFTRLLKDDWMLPAKMAGVVKIYQFQSDWLTTVFLGVRLLSFSF